MDGAVSRLLAPLAVALLGAAAIAADAALTRRLWDSAYVGGWLLFFFVLLLSAYDLRKRIHAVPLAAMTGWHRVHLHIGTLAGVVFVVHAGLRPPPGWLAGALWLASALVVASGLTGMALAHLVPDRLNHPPGTAVLHARWSSGERRRRGERVLPERIPSHMRRLAAEAAALVTAALEAGAGPDVAELYEKRLHPFFATPHRLLGHLLRRRDATEALIAEIRDCARYLAPPERDTLGRIADLVHVKDSLDYQLAHHRLMNGWRWLHGPLGWLVLLLAAAHGVLAHGFATRGPWP